MVKDNSILIIGAIIIVGLIVFGSDIDFSEFALVGSDVSETVTINTIPTAKIIADSDFFILKEGLVCHNVPNAQSSPCDNSANILDYTLTQSGDCYCGSPITLSKSKITLKTFDGWNDCDSKLSVLPLGSKLFENEEIIIKSGQGPFAYISEFCLKDGGKWNINLVQNEFYFDDETQVKKMYIKINSNIQSSITREVYFGYWTELSGGQYLLNRNLKQIQLNPGENILEFNLPANIPLGDYTFFTFIASETTFGKTSMQESDFVTKNFLVNPRRLYYPVLVGNPCPSGYILPEGTEVLDGQTTVMCVRDDISEISCLNPETPCPVTADRVYSCTSQGLCSEELYHAIGCEIDADCGEAALSCEPTTGVCFNTVIEEVITQCDSSVELFKPCEGISASCIGGEIVYSGTCEPIYRHCSDWGCPSDDLTCDTNTDVCVRTETITETITETVLVDKPITETVVIKEPTPQLPIKTILIIGGIALAAFLIFKKK